MSPQSFAVRIFLADGTVDGVQIIAKSKWSGRGLVIPRQLVAAEKEREELHAPGVYLLTGAAADDRPTLVIGAGDPVYRCLEQQAASNAAWTSALVFTAKKDQLTPAHFDYLAARLADRAGAADITLLAAPVPPAAPPLSAAGQEEAEAFLAHLLSICPLLGLTVFSAPDTEPLPLAE